MDKKAQVNKYINFKSFLELGVIFSLPFIFANALFNTYLYLQYNNLADLQAMSIIFIVGFLALAFVTIFALKHYRTLLYGRYFPSAAIFWISIFLLPPAFIYIRSLLFTLETKQIGDIITQSGIISLLFIVLAVIFIGLLTYVLERVTTRHL